MRVVNIYSVNNSYKKRKSHAQESRVQLNHSLLPQAGAQGRVSPYDNPRHGDSVQLPEIRSSSHVNHYDSHPIGSGAHGYHYKSNIDNANQAMIQKLMSRKKSYERMMKVDDGSSISPPPIGRNHINSELTSKKNAEVLLAANRSGPSRAHLHGNHSKKGALNYYDSTPPALPRKPKGKTLIAQQQQAPSLNPNSLEMTGKTVINKEKQQVNVV